MAHPDCGLFRLAEDYRDHLPCEKCEPATRGRAPVVDLNTNPAVRATIAAANATRMPDGTPSVDTLMAIGEAVIRALGLWQKPPC